MRREDVGLQVCGVQLETLKEIAQLARLAHFWQVFPVLDRLGARVEHAFQSLQRQAAPPSKSLYVAAFALCPQGDTPPELGDYFVFAFPRFYFGLSEAEHAPFARYAGAMLERFLRWAKNKEALRKVKLTQLKTHSSPPPSPKATARPDSVSPSTNARRASSPRTAPSPTRPARMNSKPGAHSTDTGA